MIFIGIANYKISSVADFTKFMIEESMESASLDYIKRQIYLRFGGDGILLYIIFDIEKGREEEGLEEIMRMMTRSGMAVEGLKWTVEPLMSSEEAIRILPSLE